jgi:hypothetical protein
MGLEGVEAVARGIPRNGRIAGEPHCWRRACGSCAFDANERDYSWPRAEAGPIGEPVAFLETVRFVERAKLAAWERNAS